MKPIVLCILDGVGRREETHGNAVLAAQMPNFNRFWNSNPHSVLEASGEFVGLPKGQMGNSEVGHMNIGAGRIVYQPLQLINEKIKDGTFFENQAFLKMIHHVKEQHSRLHLFGLLSDGGIHSHIDHLLALLELCKKEQVKEVFLHLFLDGRDTLPDVAENYVKKIETTCNQLGIGKIATLAGRYYAMDRDNRWDRVQKAYQAIVDGVGEHYNSPEEAIQENYQRKIYDEFIVPAVLDSEGMVRENDAMILFNFRPDRGRELFKALTNPAFQEFEHTTFKNVPLVTMMPLSEEVLSIPAFELEPLTHTLGEYISSLGKRQLRIAETEKYAHVTYFFDGGVERELPNCKRVLIPSPKVATYDLKPEMSALEVTDTLLEELDHDYDLVILNYANGDMVGHTGNMKATIQALETLDVCLGRLEKKVNELGGVLVITADHGNSDTMLDDQDRVVTSHSTSKVPLIITKQGIILQDGKLGDLAPTILALMGEAIPKEMTGSVLFQKEVPRRRFPFAVVFICFSIFAMVAFGGYFGYRFFHFRRLEQHPIVVDTSLAGKVLSLDTIATSGLRSDAGGYYYYGAAENNYVFYSGRLWRILSISKDKAIKLMSEEIVSSLAWGREGSQYQDASIRSFLNPMEEGQTGIFYQSLKDPTSYLQKSTYCFSHVTGETTDQCEETVEDYVGLLTYQEYKKAGANASFINNGTYFWLSDQNEENKVWYVFKEGGVNAKVPHNNSYGIRPVITLKPEVIYYSGDGTKQNPYRIEAPSIDVLEQKSVGEYVTYSGFTWRMIAATETGIKLLKDSPIEQNQTIVKRVYASKNNQFNPQDTTSIAYYLNHTFYQTLEKKEYLVKGPWYIGAYDASTDYNYQSTYQQSVEAFVGLPQIGEIIFSQEQDLLTLTPNGSEFVSVVKADGNYYTLTIEEKSAMIPAIYVKKDLAILGGDGSKESPYQI